MGHPSATPGPPKGRLAVRPLFSTKVKKRGVGPEIAVIADIAVIARDRKSKTVNQESP
jgi:hypothetical protein